MRFVRVMRRQNFVMVFMGVSMENSGGKPPHLRAKGRVIVRHK